MTYSAQFYKLILQIGLRNIFKCIFPLFPTWRASISESSSKHN